jgi:hypothetical protein
MFPVEPADDITNPAPSPSIGAVWLRLTVSKISVVPPGDFSDLPYAIVKKPTTSSPGTVVVTDGAVG